MRQTTKSTFTASATVAIGLLASTAAAQSANAPFANVNEIEGITNTQINVVDIDGDGDMDIVGREGHWESSADERLFVTINNGKAGFSSTEIDTAVSEVNDYAIGDMDGDGDLDIAFSTNLNSLSIDEGIYFFENDGSGKFWTRRTVVLDDDYGHTSLAIGDIDGDGLAEIVTSDEDDIYAYSRTTLDGEWKRKAISGHAEFHPATHMMLRDFDGDGDADILVWSTGDYTYLELLRNEGGQFSSEMTDPQTGLREITAVDMDHDGDLDLLAGGITQTLLYENSGDAKFAPLELSSSGNLMTHASVRAGDYTGNGELDIVRLQQSGNGRPGLALLELEGSEWVESPLMDSWEPGDAFFRLGSADFDCDGDEDLMIRGHEHIQGVTTFHMVENDTSDGEAGTMCNGAGGSGAGGAGGGGADGAAGGAGAGDAGGSAGPSGSNGESGTGDDGGGCTAAAGQTSGGRWLLMLMGLPLMLRRRRQSLSLRSE